MIGRNRLFGGVAPLALHSALFAGGLLLANMAAVAPALADACTAGTVIDAANGTTCSGGSTDGNLTYPDSNGNYQNGDFTLTLDNHDVTNGGIVFSGVVNGDGLIVLENDSNVSNTAGNGIEASIDAAGEDLTINVLGTSSITGSLAGIHAQALDDVSVTAGGNVTGGNSDGIFAQSGGSVAITTGEGSEVTGGAGGPLAGGSGIFAIGLDAVTVTTGASSEVSSQQGSGIGASSTSGAVSVTTGDGSTVNTQSGFNGIRAISGTGDVEVITGANAVVSGARGAGIFVQTAGAVKINTGGGVNSFVAGVDGIFASAANAVEITVGDDSQAFARSGDGGGIVANSTNGPVTITTGARSGVGGNTTNGILAAAAGAVTITVGDNAGVSSSRGDGIDASSTSGGAVTISTGAASQVSGTAGDGILASSIGGAISITTGANSLATGFNGDGIEATTLGAGTITINNLGTTRGTNGGITATSATGAIQITNNATGTIANQSLNDGDVALRTTGGAATIVNEGLILGRIETGIGNDALVNNGRWETVTFNIFGEGIDIATNNGVILAANSAGATSFTNFDDLETLNNNGSIILVDQLFRDGSNSADRFSTGGDYAGLGNAVLAVDASLGGGASNSDALIVAGNTSGVTRIVVNNTSLGAGALNTEGILVVNVLGTAQVGNFVLANGPIDAGFFVYDLIFNNTDQANDQFLLVSEADGELFEPLAMVASSQEIWRETADAWAARQQAVRDRLSFGPIVTAVADPPLPGGIAPENGLWFSGLGSWTARNSEISGFDLSYDQSIYGFVAGADFGVDLGSDSTLMFGLLAGYIDSSLNFDASPTSIKTDGATLGVYASLVDGGFFANVLIQADLLNQTFSAPSVGADSSDDADVVSIGARADLGYRFDMDGLFIEPVLSLDAMSTSIDEFSVGGADIDAGSNESFRGGAGLRAGLAGERATASLTGRIWNVFATDNEVVFTAEDTLLDLSDDGLEGLYGEVSGQVDVDLSETTVLFVKGGVLFSDDVTKPSVSGGFNFTW